MSPENILKLHNLQIESTRAWQSFKKGSGYFRYAASSSLSVRVYCISQTFFAFMTIFKHMMLLATAPLQPLLFVNVNVRKTCLLQGKKILHQAALCVSVFALIFNIKVGLLSTEKTSARTQALEKAKKAFEVFNKAARAAIDAHNSAEKADRDSMEADGKYHSSMLEMARAANAAAATKIEIAAANAIVNRLKAASRSPDRAILNAVASIKRAGTDFNEIIRCMEEVSNESANEIPFSYHSAIAKVITHFQAAESAAQMAEKTNEAALGTHENLKKAALAMTKAYKEAVDIDAYIEINPIYLDVPGPIRTTESHLISAQFFTITPDCTTVYRKMSSHLLTDMRVTNNHIQPLSTFIDPSHHDTKNAIDEACTAAAVDTFITARSTALKAVVNSTSDDVYKNGRAAMNQSNNFMNRLADNTTVYGDAADAFTALNNAIVSCADARNANRSIHNARASIFNEYADYANNTLLEHAATHYSTYLPYAVNSCDPEIITKFNQIDFETIDSNALFEGLKAVSDAYKNSNCSDLNVTHLTLPAVFDSAAAFTIFTNATSAGAAAGPGAGAGAGVTSHQSR